jgi:hypothetical protein
MGAVSARIGISPSLIDYAVVCFLGFREIGVAAFFNFPTRYYPIVRICFPARLA